MRSIRTELSRLRWLRRGSALNRGRPIWVRTAATASVLPGRRGHQPLHFVTTALVSEWVSLNAAQLWAAGECQVNLTVALGMS